MRDCRGAGGMGRPPKRFYPSLMDLPSVLPEQRQYIEAEARSWISAGADEITRAESAPARQCGRRHRRGAICFLI